ncbi:MAG: metallophosphoesterase [Bacillota bacterium]
MATGKEEKEIRILAVSDIHNNPQALEFVERVVAGFDVDMVVDAGDMTDWGATLDGLLVAAVERIPVPYLLVAGNHEAPGTMDALAGKGMVQVVDGLVEVRGVSVLGIPDPGSWSLSPAVKVPLLEQQRKEVEGRLSARSSPPHILVVHNPRVASTFAGQVPLIVTGHTHTAGVCQTGGTAMINPGTAGAARRGLDPHGVAVIYLTRAGQGPAPEAVDLISVTGIGATFTVQHVLVDRAGP